MKRSGANVRPGGFRRAAVLLIVVAAVAGAATLDTLHPSRTAAAGGAASQVQQVWVCPDTPQGDTFTSEVDIAAAEGHPLSGTIEVLPDGTGAGRADPVTVPPNGRVTVPIAQLGSAGGAAIVTLPPGRVAVAAKVVYTPKGGRPGVAGYPCTDRTSASWWFAVGNTEREQAESLAIANPTRTPAVVHVSFATDTGPETPEATRVLTVPARARLVVPVHEAVLRHPYVAAHVVAETGRIVVTEAMLPDGGTRGYGETLGAPAPATSWYLTGGELGGAVPGETESVGLLNVDDRDLGSVDVTALPDTGGDQSAPRKIEVAPGSGQLLDLTGTADQGQPVGLAVKARSGALIVDQTRSSGGFALFGAAAAPARQWLVASGPPDGSGGEIEIANPGDTASQVQVAVLPAGGAPSPTQAAGGVTVPAGARVSVALADLKLPSSGGLLVTMSEPGVVSRTWVEQGDLAGDLATPLP